MIKSLDTIPACDKRTDGQMPGIDYSDAAVRMPCASRGKKKLASSKPGVVVVAFIHGLKSIERGQYTAHTHAELGPVYFTCSRPLEPVIAYVNQVYKLFHVYCL